NNSNKLFGFTLAEMLVALAVVSVIASIIVPSLKALTPSSNKALLKKAYSTTEKVIFHILAKKNSEKQLIFKMDEAFMDTTPDANSGTYNKFCYYFKDEMNTLDLTGVDCPAAGVVSGVPVRFAKTPDGVDWFIVPAAFSAVNFDQIASLTNTAMQTYAAQKGTEAVNAKMSEIEASANAAKTSAYNEAMSVPSEIIETNNGVKPTCSINQHCQCSNSDTQYKYFKVDKTSYESEDGTSTEIRFSTEELSKPAAIQEIKDAYNRTDFDSVCGSTDYCLMYDDMQAFEMDLETRNTKRFVHNMSIAVIPTLKTYSYSVNYSLVGVAYPDFKSSGTLNITKSFSPYVSDSIYLEFKTCPPCEEVERQASDDKFDFCEYSGLKSALNEKISLLKNSIANHITQLQNTSRANMVAAANSFAAQKYNEVKQGLISQVRAEAEQTAINDTSVYNSYYQQYMNSASGTGNKLKDFPLKIIVDVNGMAKGPNCSADSSSYAASYMPSGYRNTNCTDPDTFIFGIRYDGKIRIANAASSYSVTAYSDPVAKDYLSDFIRN
ncbi:MAG: type II secretion system GspH family protein, partial [bacterium]|nr:type II secretion system GspH family protein [bacterium]